MSFPQIPKSLLQNPDRNAVFRDLKSWMQNEWQDEVATVEDAIPSGSPKIDSVLAGGYAPGRITEIVEPTPSRGVQSLIHHALSQARKRQQYIGLIDLANQFDPQSASPLDLQSLLWLRINKTKDAIKACDILIRDGNFSSILFDLRNTNRSHKLSIRPTEWYRIQRVCEQSKVALIAFTQRSTIPCAFVRLQLSSPLPFNLFDQLDASGINAIECDLLKHRTSFSSKDEAYPQTQPSALKVANGHK